MLNSIMITPSDIKLGKEIPKYRKEVLYKVYNQYGKLNDYKLDEIVRLGNSPVNVDRNPYLLALVMKLSLPLADEAIKKWYCEDTIE